MGGCCATGTTPYQVSNMEKHGAGKDGSGSNGTNHTSSASSAHAHASNGTTLNTNTNNNHNNTRTVDKLSSDAALTDIHRTHTLTTPIVDDAPNSVRRVSTGGAAHAHGHTPAHGVDGSTDGTATTTTTASTPNNTTPKTKHGHVTGGRGGDGENGGVGRTISIDSTAAGGGITTIHGGHTRSHTASKGTGLGRPGSPVLYMPTDSSSYDESSASNVNGSIAAALHHRNNGGVPTIPIPPSPTLRLQQLSTNSTPKHGKNLVPTSPMAANGGMPAITPRTAAARRLLSDHMSHVRQTSLLSIDGLSASGSPRMKSPRVDLDKELAHTDGHTDDVVVHGGVKLRQFKNKPVAIMVSDMSGFTRITRLHGIIHFASIIVRMRQLCYPVIQRYHPLSVETEADDFLVVFSSVADAVRCAHEMIETTKLYNKTVKEEKYQVLMGGLGVDWGRIVQDEATGKLYGDAADGSFQLGEDISDREEILVSHRAHAEIKDLPDWHHIKFDRKEGEEDLIECLDGHFYSVIGAPTLDHPLHCTPTTDVKYIGASLGALASRHATNVDVTALDRDLEAKYMGGDTAVIMFGLHVEEVTHRYGMIESIKVKSALLRAIRPHIDKCRGHCVEETFLTFQHPADAVLCALEMKKTIRTYNATHPENQQIQPKGFGVHIGRMLIVPGTNVHWGDCVSTASKLGEDLADDEEILISDLVYQRIYQRPEFVSVKFMERHLSVSGVNFTCYRVSLGEDSVSSSDLRREAEEVLNEEKFGSTLTIDPRRPSGIAHRSTIITPGASAHNTSVSPSIGGGMGLMSISAVKTH